MKYLLLLALLCGCAEATAPQAPDFSRGCVYTDTVVVDGPVNGVIPPPPYPVVILRSIINDADECAAAAAAFPGKVQPR